MKLTKEHFGATLFPLLASGYATFSLWEHLTKEYRDLTVNYGLIVNVPILVLSAIAIANAGGRFFRFASVASVWMIGLAIFSGARSNCPWGPAMIGPASPNRESGCR